MMFVHLQEIPETAQETGFDAMLLADGKILAVLAVVLIIWFGLLYFIFRTDRKLARLERTLAERDAFREAANEKRKTEIENR